MSDRIEKYIASTGLWASIFFVYLLIVDFAIASDETKQDTYSLATGKSGSQRLDAQHKLMSELGYKQLEKAGLSEGQTVWDIGCGNGAMTVYLAQKVGNKGHVYAIDISDAQIKIAREKVSAEGLTNVTFIHGDIRTQKDLPSGKADLVYMRLVLMHVNDPASVIVVIKNLLKEGGVAVSQESIMKTIYSSSDNPVFKEYMQTLLALGNKLGVDYNVGEKLGLLYEQAGFVRVQIDYRQQKLSVAQMKELLSKGIEWKNRAIEAGVTTSERMAVIERTIKEWPDDDKDFFLATAKQAYVLAWKRDQ
ncbi:MAG: methyltransferase domain-containing protein [Alphaproteobacteria bacterium]|nr:methyltransferase domain-containing protein [Alphaproteobacteria bacterium]